MIPQANDLNWCMENEKIHVDLKGVKSYIHDISSIISNSSAPLRLPDEALLSSRRCRNDRRINCRTRRDDESLGLI